MNSRRKWDAVLIWECLSCGRRSIGSARRVHPFLHAICRKASNPERQPQVTNQACAHRRRLTTCQSILLPSGRTAAMAAFRGGLAVPFTECATNPDRGEEAAVAPRRCARTWLTAVRRVTKDVVENRSLILRVFLPFVAGYSLAYLFRTINAVIAAPLATELGLAAGDLGLLISVYFLTSAAAQILIGVLLDRYGPRRIQSALLVVAAVGAALFAASDHFLGLLAGRALTGLGVAAALTAGLKALILWFP